MQQGGRRIREKLTRAGVIVYFLRPSLPLTSLFFFPPPQAYVSSQLSFVRDKLLF